MGLNKSLDEVRGRLLGTKPLPSLREVFSEVHREESRKRVMMGSPNAAHIHDGFAFTTLKDHLNDLTAHATRTSGDGRS